jgi:intracellular sulfur oxidation DsrE/DsrF family protein
MPIKNTLASGLSIFCLVLAPGFGAAAMAADSPGGEIRVDIPVVLKNAKVLFDIGRAPLAGDIPVALRFMDIMANRFAEQGTKGRIVGVFYGEATYLLLNDVAYNASRRVTTGNPYKGLISRLQGQGVQIEVCGTAMMLQKIRNDDLLPEVKVNGGANLRMVQLMQEGFVRLQP